MSWCVCTCNFSIFGWRPFVSCETTVQVHPFPDHPDPEAWPNRNPHPVTPTSSVEVAGSQAAASRRSSLDSEAITVTFGRSSIGAGEEDASEATTAGSVPPVEQLRRPNS